MPSEPETSLGSPEETERTSSFLCHRAAVLRHHCWAMPVIWHLSALSVACAVNVHTWSIWMMALKPSFYKIMSASTAFKENRMELFQIIIPSICYLITTTLMQTSFLFSTRLLRFVLITKLVLQGWWGTKLCSLSVLNFVDHMVCQLFYSCTVFDPDIKVVHV